MAIAEQTPMGCQKEAAAPPRHTSDRPLQNCPLHDLPLIRPPWVSKRDDHPHQTHMVHPMTEQPSTEQFMGPCPLSTPSVSAGLACSPC
mmetsp:Transcript_12533/g.34234  ORF Transcript_12533/g.34234 Transcript_12533/m.34234 type:complete len:89 (+) Transcript_12533:1198-1464(+)